MSAATSTAWLGVPVTCRLGASWRENTPLTGSTTTCEPCRSTSPHASDVGRAANTPMFRASPANNVLRMMSTL